MSEVSFAPVELSDVSFAPVKKINCGIITWSRGLKMFSFSLTTAVRGFHVYKDVWEPTIGEVLSCERDVGNSHDTFAVATKKSTEVVGHVPRFLSSICSIFIRRGGEIVCRITGTRRYSADLPQGGMEIPCILIFKSQSIKECSKTEHLIKSAKNISSEVLSAITSVDSGEGNIKQSAAEDSNEACTCTSSKSSSPIKVSHLSADDVIEMLTSDEDEVEPPAKKLRCTIDIERVIMNQKLSDIEINFSQRLLKSQFPEINGLESTLLQDKNHVSKQPNHSKLQIIHCKERDHWITATTIGCEVGVIKVYDSLYTTLDKPTSTVLANFFHSQDQLFKKRVIRPQKQNGGSDCGVFAIAFATSIAINHKVDMKFDQARMRAHLVRCIEKRELSLFPSK